MIKKLRDFKVENKRVLVRCDFNVPQDEQGNILDNFRIIQTLPTINYLLANKAKIILMSHLGDPGGQAVPNLKLDKVQEELAKHLNVPVTKSPDCIGYEVESYSYGLKPGEILLLENLRFHPGETANDSLFARELSKLGDIYINDAFGVCHREHASVVALPQLMTERGVGLLLEKEIRTLEKIMQKPKRPMLAIVGGKKVETKANLIQNILKFSDKVIVSGLIKEEIDRTGMKFDHQEKLIGPVDAVEFEGKQPDIGPKSVELFKKEIRRAKTIFWNGPFGMIEKEEYAKGTLEIAKAIAKSWSFSVTGGGETVEFLSKVGLSSKFDHVSTGGGAMLSFLSGEQLVALQPLIVNARH